MDANVHFVPNDEDGSQTAIIGPSGQAKSILGDLTPEEGAEMMAWSDKQPHSPAGAINLMDWPGWPAVMARRFKDRFGEHSTHLDD